MREIRLCRFTKSADATDVHDFLFYKYGKLISSTDVGLQQTGTKHTDWILVDDLLITETNKSTVDSYTEIDNPIKFYDRAASYLEDNLGTYLDFIVTRSGNLIDAGSYNVTIDATAASAFNVTGNLITIKASTYTGDMTTTGIIALANGAIFSGVRTDQNGTVLPPKLLTLTGLEIGSDVIIKNPSIQSDGVDNNVIYRANNIATTTAVWEYENAPSSTVDVEIYKAGFKMKALRGLSTASSQTLPTIQDPDPVYV